MMTVDYQPNTAANTSAGSKPQCFDITVVIPTYNGAARISQVLDRLQQQLQTDGLAWEVIVCDNNSCDLTADIVAEYQCTWSQAFPLRYCFVAEQGAAFARQRGVIEAKGDIVAFLDDDNIPAHDWLWHVHRFAQAHPRAGAFGSQIHGDFQGELPNGFDHIACFLAIVERGSEPHLYQPRSKILPPAAGLAVRRRAWVDTVPDRLFLNHKGKSAGLASEDLEAMLHIQKAGWEIWYNSDMVITHQIPEERLQQDYLVALFRCVGLSRFYIRLLGTEDWQRSFKIPAYVANDLRKLTLHYLKNGFGKSHLDTVAACERALLTSTVVSPTFLLRKAAQDFWQRRLDNAQLPERQKWLQRLTQAFEDRQLVLYQQEVFSYSDTSSTVRSSDADRTEFEILLRLCQRSPERSLISPKQFFPTAERYGLMRTLDRRVIQQALRAFSNCSIKANYSINLSSASVFDSSFLPFLEDQLKRYPVDPERLCFEISASVMLNASTKTLIERLKNLNLSVAIDEVTSSFKALDDIDLTSIDCIKLGAQLTDCSDQSNAVLSAWVESCHQHDIQLVAKGIETQAQLEQLKGLGIQYFQGYQLSEPVPLAQIPVCHG